MDRALSWFLFILFFIVAVLVTAEILGRLQQRSLQANLTTTSAIHRSPIPEAVTTSGMAGSILNLETGKQAPTPVIIEEEPDVVPAEVDYSRELLEQQSTEPQSPAPEPAVSDPAIEFPAIGSLAMGNASRTAISDFTIGAPRIGEIGEDNFEKSILWDDEAPKIEAETKLAKLSKEPVSPLIAASMKFDDSRKKPNTDPSSLWYRAYSSALMARELESRGDHEAARKKYEESKACYDILNLKFPQFESEHIKNGSELLAAKLSKLGTP